ncbi:VanZ like family protein [Caprobacter fermentans]|uniref:VanZ like family protein n=1 Tax=Caproicibacter fermentans TaxID=2576756 RepID=A0A6N8HX40_9FIRM|nr:VanZ family protein [Caproicibacter fermentans]MVB10239.1 VanZ like family protein [Caproicibacter fermentans]
MDNKIGKKERILSCCIYAFFILYIVFLLRITLFKQAPMYNLFAAIGASERTISIIPFKSIFDMISTDVSLMRILENVFGNIIIFIPFGLLLPMILKKENKNTILNGVIFSAFIEIIQFILGLGSTDIDDLIFNTIGVITGYLLFTTIKKQSKSNLSFLVSVTTLVLISGSIAFGIMFVNNTDLFLISPTKITVENRELVEDFIETHNYLSGKFVEVKDSILTVEKRVHNASEKKELLDVKITPDSRIYICYVKIDYFFSTVSGEHQRYEQILYSDFISNESKVIKKGNNVSIWSSDGKKIDSLVVFLNVL